RRNHERRESASSTAGAKRERERVEFTQTSFSFCFVLPLAMLALSMPRTPRERRAIAKSIPPLSGLHETMHRNNKRSRTLYGILVAHCRGLQGKGAVKRSDCVNPAGITIETKNIRSAIEVLHPVSYISNRNKKN
ncbi:MAG: hypothetical protein IIV65_00100, partial [Alistipes sp.]|nr:hypothetical protein [Alistipes sp.]